MVIAIIGGFVFEARDVAAVQAYGMVQRGASVIASDDELIRQIGDAQIVVVMLTKLSKRVLSSCPQLKHIVLATTGYDTIDLEAAAHAGITVSYIPGYATNAVAEHTFVLLLAVARNLFTATHDLRAGICTPEKYQGVELQGKTIGVIGMGRIGSRVADIAIHGFGMRLLAYDQESSMHDLRNLCAASDVISLHLPLNEATRNFCDDTFFAQCKAEMLFINTARGGLVDEDALLQALASGTVAAAGLDVLCQEPAARDNRLVCHPRVVVTPHIAYDTHDALVRRSAMVAENVIAAIEGNPIRLVPKK